MKFEEILITKYSTQFAQGLFSLKDNNDGLGVVIDLWNIPDVPRPTHEEVMAMEPEVQAQFALDNAKDTVSKLIKSLLDTTAQVKGYDNALSIASYVTSSVAQWGNEARAFVTWRDAVFNYAITLLQQVEGGAPMPSIEEFLANMPQIAWPQ